MSSNVNFLVKITNLKLITLIFFVINLCSLFLFLFLLFLTNYLVIAEKAAT